MKSKILTLALAILSSMAYAQTQECDTCINLKQNCDNTEELKVMYINKNVSTHFIAMEDISYVDISNNSIVGDIPVNNIVRIKPVEEGADGIITIVTESYFVQYMMVYTDDLSKVYTKHNIQYSELTSLMNPEKTMTKSDLIDYAGKMYNQNKHYYDVSTTKRRLRLTLNNIYTVNKYFFIDISLLNKSNIQFDIDQIKFSIEDKKIFRKTNVQSIEIKPIASFNDDMTFKRTYRNIFVFEKFTFPGDKMFTIEISEKQISGRTIILRISYADVLAADSFNIK